MVPMDDKEKAAIVDRLKLAHPNSEIHTYESASAGAFVVHRTANPAERRNYRKLRNEDKPLDAGESLMKCVLYPEAAEMTKLFETKPFFIEMLEDAILGASGIVLDAVRKKA